MVSAEDLSVNRVPKSNLLSSRVLAMTNMPAERRRLKRWLDRG